MLALVLVVLASPFPVPTLDGKPLSANEEQRTFRVPMRFQKVRAFYVTQLKDWPEVTLTLTGTAGKRVLTIANRGRRDAWLKATVSERETETVIDVVPVLRMEETEVIGRARPLVQFIIGRSAAAEEAAVNIDHTEQIRR
jgi:hypothetical protein